ncbi:hypothetical protein ACFV13_12130 [Streptomyces bauhiniae]|uniref:hypothetical protein n=1 Tax=Streptomyces bauhiniae TaxID=2340725 RepID=UPI00367E0713
MTNAVSEESRWPGLLGWIQDHAWASFLQLGGLLVVMSAALAALSETRDGTPTATPTSCPEASPPQEGPLSAVLLLRSLPRDTTVFTDQTAELEVLVRSVREAQERGEALPVHVIDEMPGVGKTAFAVHAAQLMTDRFPDGQLFVNLHGPTTGRSQCSPATRSRRCWRRPRCGRTDPGR